MLMWNLWHGCHKISPGCKHCYVYRQDEKFGIDSSIVKKTKNFDLPIKRKHSGEYIIPSATLVFTCFTSDFFVEDADIWRDEAWAMVKKRKDLDFLIITKRIDRFYNNLPEDWSDGYDNVVISCTVENQDKANYRLSIFKKLPIKHKLIICEPILEQINLSSYLDNSIEEVVVGGESGNGTRICNYDWVLDIRNQCIKSGVNFKFKQTGAYFKKENKIYKVRRKFQHLQAQKAEIDYQKT